MNVASPSPPKARLAVVDWLRGLAVVLMIQTHLYDAWVSPAVKVTSAYRVTRFLGGIPSRLFLLLVGVSIALRFEAQLAKGVRERRAFIRPVQIRGLEILVLAYLFRVQEYVLGHMQDSIANLPKYGMDILRIDILNCIGASMLLVPVIAAPRAGRPAWLLTLAAAAVFVGLGPIIGPADLSKWLPTWLPTWLTAYFGGLRPMSWFALFPWAAWPLVGVAIGHAWSRASTDGHRQARAFVITGLAGGVLVATVEIIRAIDPHVIRYPSELVQQMGPGSFFYRLGLNGLVALLGWAVVRASGDRFSIMQQFGRTSLLVYWVHIDLCYGLIARKLGLYGALGMGAATVGLVVMIALMLALSWTKTRYFEPWWRERIRSRATRSMAAGP